MFFPLSSSRFARRAVLLLILGAWTSAGYAKPPHSKVFTSAGASAAAVRATAVTRRTTCGTKWPCSRPHSRYSLLSSTKQGLSLLVITMDNQHFQHRTTSHGTPPGDEVDESAGSPDVLLSQWLRRRGLQLLRIFAWTPFGPSRAKAPNLVP